MPLHIFEERYRTMLADCLAGDERFGIVLITPEGEPPAPGIIGCTAHIRATQLLADGRSNIVVIGEHRFIVEEYVTESVPYAVAQVEDLAEDETSDISAQSLIELKRLGRIYLDTLHRLNDSTAPDTSFPDDPATLSFHLSAALELDSTVKQQLLATHSTLERIRLLLALLPPLVRDHQARALEHEHARTNGKSSRPWKSADPS